MTAPAPGELLDFAVDLAVAAGALALRHFLTPIVVQHKADRSPVTVADRETERFLREAIERRFPDDGIVGEEYGVLRPDSHRRWFFDPIDGTRSFVRGVPFWGTMIALVEGGEPVLGVVRLPALDETVCAARGEGCRWNGATARVSEVGEIGDALILTTDAESMPAVGREAAWNRLRSAGGLCRTWGDCYGYALVATGRAEAMIDPVLNEWDAAALFPIIEEAGGVVTDLDGLRRFDGGNLVATNRALAAGVGSLIWAAP